MRERSEKEALRYPVKAVYTRIYTGKKEVKVRSEGNDNSIHILPRKFSELHPIHPLFPLYFQFLYSPPILLAGLVYSQDSALSIFLTKEDS